MVLQWNANFPRHDRSNSLVGLYVETKMYNFYLNQYGADISQEVFNVLQKYDLETVEKASAKLPIILECFEKESLIKLDSLTDLPLIYLMFWNNPHV